MRSWAWCSLQPSDSCCSRSARGEGEAGNGRVSQAVKRRSQQSTHLADRHRSSRVRVSLERGAVLVGPVEEVPSLLVVVTSDLDGVGAGAVAVPYAEEGRDGGQRACGGHEDHFWEGALPRRVTKSKLDKGSSHHGRLEDEEDASESGEEGGELGHGLLGWVG